MKIKVCGLKYPENIKSAADLMPDYMGFIFYQQSPRYIDGETLKSFGQVPAVIKKTAVFVNETQENISSLIEKYNFDAIQLHGDETPEFCFYFKGKTVVLKAFGLNEDFDFNRLDPYADKVDYFLLDTKTITYGGSGKTFNWNLLNNYKLDVPFFLSGGIGLENLDEVKHINHQQFYGIDLNSKFEIAPGIKDISKLQQAFNILKQTIDK